MSALHEAARRVVSAWVSTRPAWIEQCNAAVMALDAALKAQPEPAQDERTTIADLRCAKWLDPECADKGACQSLKFKRSAEPAQGPVACIRTWHKDGEQHAELRGWEDGIEGLPDGEHLLYTAPQPHPEPAQEPFGYLWPTGRHPEFRFTQQKRDGVAGTPIYTAPPQRPPLTDDEIDRLWHDNGAGIDAERFARIARAVERKVRGE